MVSQFGTYSFICLFTTIAVLVVAVAAWQRRATPGAKSLVAFLIVVSIWSLTGAFEAAAVDLATKIFWSKIQYLGSINASVLYLVFTLEYSRQSKWLTLRRLSLLWIVPTITIVLAWSNEWHHLIWTGFTPAGNNQYTYEHGAAFWAAIVFIYLVLCIGFILNIRNFIKARGPYRQQIGLIVLSSFIPFVINIPYMLKINPFSSMDFTPISFSLVSLFLALSIFRYRLFDLIPIARDVLIENMKDCVVVIDMQNRIVDINPAAKQLLKLGGNAIGNDLKDALSSFPDLAFHLNNAIDSHEELSLGNNPPRFVEIQIIPLTGKSGKTTGRLAILRDITERKRIEEALKEKSRQLERLAVTDSLTQLYNRRYADRELAAEFSRAERYQQPLSIGLFDIDKFKLINDTFGHACGDEILTVVAEVFRVGLRDTDTCARVGGDEFLIILPSTPLEEAMAVVERLQEKIGQIKNLDTGNTITISGGITAWFPGDQPDEAYKRVDRLLLQAKAFGRNRILMDNK